MSLQADDGPKIMPGQDTPTESGVSVSRRAYLRTVGAATTVATGGSLASATAAGSDHRTVEVPPGEHVSVDVPDGGTLENVLYDVTADGASVFFNANGNDWTMRNVGVRGVHDTGEALMHASVPDAGGTGVVENVYFGDGSNDGTAIGIWVDGTGSDAHRGTVVFDRVHVARFANNGIYGSGPGVHLGPDDAGEVHVRNSLARNNNIAQIRLGTSGSTITNSLALVDDDVPPNEDDIANGRGLWLREGARDVSVEDSATVIRHRDGSRAIVAEELRRGIVENSVVEGPVEGEGNLELRDVRREVPKNLSPPSGVPTSAEEAVTR